MMDKAFIYLFLAVCLLLFFSPVSSIKLQNGRIQVKKKSNESQQHQQQHSFSSNSNNFNALFKPASFHGLMKVNSNLNDLMTPSFGLLFNAGNKYCLIRFFFTHDCLFPFFVDFIRYLPI
jgi:hypothetical protein